MEKKHRIVDSSQLLRTRFPENYCQGQNGKAEAGKGVENSSYKTNLGEKSDWCMQILL